MGIEISDKALALFDMYYDNLVTWNEKFNLTALTGRRDVDVKHFADSLSAARFFPQGSSVVDVGSGAGFPAIPLKIMRSDLSVTMLDSLNKRVNFLLDTLAVLDIEGRAFHMRAEDAAYTDMRERFDVATARAVANTKLLAQYLLPLVRVGGRAILYKSGEIEEEIKEAQSAIKTLGGQVTHIERCDFEGLGRTIVIIDKIFSTPTCYPRKKIK